MFHLTSGCICLLYMLLVLFDSGAVLTFLEVAQVQGSWLVYTGLLG